MLNSALKEAGGKEGISETEANALSSICMMGVAVTGKENPREMIRGISDPLLNRIVANREVIKKNPVIGKVEQIFFLEWCYRNGHLEHDWAWKWSSPKEGKLYFRSKIPLDKIKVPEIPEVSVVIV